MEFKKKLEVRWGDLDANRHVGNTAYMEYLNSSRMALLTSVGFGQSYLQKHQLGPVVLHEDYFFKSEILGDDKAWVEIELGGYSEDYRFVQFHQKIYTERKGLSCISRITFAWFDLKTRKIVALGDELVTFLKELKRSESFKLLTKENMPSL